MPPPRPRWETNKKQPPPKVQKAQKIQKTKPVDPEPQAAIPLELQQLLLNIFKDSFAERFATDVKPRLQEVKGHLYNRDFAAAFGKTEYLETYAARWSASRALGYADLFWELRPKLWPDDDHGHATEGERDGSLERKGQRVVCLGGGAGAELVALAGVRRLSCTADGCDGAHSKGTMNAMAVDIADWTPVISSLTKHLTTAPTLSKYASAAIKVANAPLVTFEDFCISFQQLDVLTGDHDGLTTILKDAALVTLMFTLNELYSTSLALTQKFLLNLTASLPKGAMLLVVDSPGSYSTITLNGAEKKYPMQWLLDHTLLNQASSDVKETQKSQEASWEKVHEDESRWFRLDSVLRYPIELENMRMQLHLYRRI
jgi:25S rRNA (uracil2843-N3)-methyltransferase